MSDRPSEITSRINEIQKTILKLGQDQLDFAQLIAVSKYSPVEEIVMAYESGQLDFGENRVPELKEKALYFLAHQYDQVRWHFIGHLQTNKVKDLLRVPNLYAIHSIDSIKLIEELLKRESELDGKKCKILLQYNTSKEDEKSGFESLEELHSAIELLSTNKGAFDFHGLMTMGSIRTNDVEKEARRCFKELIEVKKSIEEKFQFSHLKLSMGMSGDYEIALALGSNYIRIGTMIFK